MVPPEALSCYARVVIKYAVIRTCSNGKRVRECQKAKFSRKKRKGPGISTEKKFETWNETEKHKRTTREGKFASRTKQGRKYMYRDAGKSLARPGRKQSRATEDFDVHISYLLS